jgi:hypothetical protein
MSIPQNWQERHRIVIPGIKDNRAGGIEVCLLNKIGRRDTE